MMGPSQTKGRGWRGRKLDGPRKAEIQKLDLKERTCKFYTSAWWESE